MKKIMNGSVIRNASAHLARAGVIALLAANTALQAADAKTDVKPEPKKWESVVTAGATLTRGNSRTFLGTIALNTKRKWPDDELLFGASAGYGQNSVSTPTGRTENTTDSYIKGFGQWNHLFTSNFFGGLRVSGDHDDIAHLTYRITISPLAGYYLVKRTNAFLVAEVGPSYLIEKFFGENEKDYVGLRAAERGEYKFASGAKIWESVEIVPKVENFDNYLINAEAGVSAPISKALSVSLILQDTYKSVPATGKLKNDMKLIAGLTYNF